MSSSSPLDRLAIRISEHSRRKKLAQFLSILAPLPGETILDVGVNIGENSDVDNFLERHYAFPERITALGIGDMAPFQRRYPRVNVVPGDGKSLPFADHSFDIAYSNAVIEHVGGHEAQKAFLRELVRVAGRGYLTTPNRHFPVEVHTRLPLLHLLLPRRIFNGLLTRIGKSWASGDYMYLLSRKDLEVLFAEAGVSRYRIIRNRFMGLSMTFTAVWRTTH